MTPDWSAKEEPVPYAKLRNPQSLNLYIYVMDNPVTGLDPDGHSDGFECPKCRSVIDAIENGMDSSDALYIINTTASSVKVLGQSVTISYSANLAASERFSAGQDIVSAATLLNDNASNLSGDETKAIKEITSISITESDPMGATGRHGMSLEVGYMKAGSVAWLASVFGHEGQHHLNAGEFKGESLWRDEQSAGRTQLGIGRKIGFTDAEIDSLERWTDDKNRENMQTHMEQPYVYQP
jgi:hypothetical protein